MNPAHQPDVEAARLLAIQQYRILGSPPEERFDELTALAANVCGTPIALITFFDGRNGRLWIKSSTGCASAEVLPAPFLDCLTIPDGEFLVVPDTNAEAGWSEAPIALSGENIRFVAGAPIHARLAAVDERKPAAYAIGALWVLDKQPRQLDSRQCRCLRALAQQVLAQLQLRKIDEDLRHSEAFYHSLVETIPQNIFRKDIQGRFTFANSRFCQTVRRPLSEVIGKTDFELFPPELAAKYQQDDRHVLEHKVPLTTIEQHRDSNGNTLYVQVIKSPILDGTGKISGVQGIFWDETDRYKAEEALAYERDLLRAMLDNIPDSIYFKDQQSRFLAVSRSLAIRLGLSNPEEAIGKTDREFFGGSHSSEAMEDEQTILRTGQPIVGKTEKELSRDGKERWVLTTKVPLKNTQGEIIGTFGISKDITALKRAEIEIANARDAALDSARLKSEFLANMSHEIRTPLNAVIGMTGLLLDTPLAPEQRDFAESIRNSADALLNIINDILDFSKIEAGKMAIETIDFDLNDVVEGTTELLAESAQAKEIELASWVHEEVPRHLRGDPGRLRQILTNLLGNAVKFTAKGEVVLEVTQAREEGGQVFLKFSVRDTGIGVPLDAQSRLFQAFTQADGSTTRRYGGTGLGLAISRQLAELMHGEIGFESTPGKGSTFWFAVPLEKQPDQTRSAQMISTLEGFHLLIVDDNETNRDIVHHQVESWKMRNATAPGGAEALEMLTKAAAAGDPFHLAILDMQMPGMDGLTLARTIKANPSIAGTHLVMLTSLGYLPEERRWRDAGIAAYLIKPVKENRLYDTLANVLRGSALPGGKSTPAGVGSPGEPNRRSVRILIAEDNVVNQKVALRQLQKHGYSADAVANGLEVLQAIKHIPYDIILMDCQMPELDGYEATRLIRAEEAQRPGRRLYIIAMTANALSGDREECLTAGMDDYVSKPVRMQELEAAINRGLQQIQNAPSENDMTLLDQEILQSVRDLRTPGEPDPLAELIDLFLQDTPPRIGKILDAFKAGDLPALERAAHSLKGSSSNLGANHLAGACFEVMNSARSGKLPEASTVARILSEFERLKPALEKERNA